MGIGSRLKTLLKERNMTIKELSELSDVSLNTLYSITKRDNGSARYDIVEKLASALDVLPGDLLEDARFISTHDINIFTNLIKNLPPERQAEEFRKYIRGIMLVSNIGITEQLEELDCALPSETFHALAIEFSKLNDNGQGKVIAYTEDLTKIPEYQKDSSDQ